MFYTCSMARDGLRVGIMPSEFMKQLRPDEFSDTRGGPAFKLDTAVFEHRLETITARNRTHEFEIFCRKLCERSICPNLRPATGPEGGGDSKADSETLPVAPEISDLTYVGSPDAGASRWAFAFSAKAKWKEKARADIDGIAATDRGYTKVFFVTSQSARAKDRSALEDELSQKHGFQVVILDRAWIVKRVVDEGLAELAIDYLGVGERIEGHRLGPNDYARTLQLEALEKDVEDPAPYAGMESQRVTDSILVATLSRELQRPRTETDGRFDRAIRLADKRGFARQKLQARYEQIWTAFYWHDDIDFLHERYDGFADLALPSGSARDLEYVSTLTSNLLSAVTHGHRTAAELSLHERRGRLKTRLDQLAADTEFRNNALEARVLVLLHRFGTIALEGDPDGLEALWLEFSDVLKAAEGLLEFEAERLIQMITRLGEHAGRSQGYSQLVDELAAFASRRRGEGGSGRILLERSRQLDIVADRLEIIRILGKACRQLAKREHSDGLIEATYVLTVAYRGAGMLWAARSQALFCLASIVAAADATLEMSVNIAPALVLLGWIDAELGLLPEWLSVVQLLAGCRKTLPFDDESKDTLGERLKAFDMMLAWKLLNLGEPELAELSFLPDILGGLGLEFAQASLLYVLGYKDQALGPPTPGEGPSDADMHELFCELAGHPAGEGLALVMNEAAEGHLETSILGMTVAVSFKRSATTEIVAEALLAVLEAIFATALGADVLAFIERFDIRIVEGDAPTPSQVFEDGPMRATLTWPRGKAPFDETLFEEAKIALIVMAAGIMAKTTAVPNAAEYVHRQFEDEALAERLSVAMTTATCHHRVFRDYVSSLSAWREHAAITYPIRPDRPHISPKAPSFSERPQAVEPGDVGTDHRRLKVRSILDLPLWEKSGWVGLMFMVYAPPTPPVLALQFTDSTVAEAIFRGWRERVGERDTDDDIHLALIRQLPGHPSSHYAALLTANVREALKTNVVTTPSRVKILEPKTDRNLAAFLQAYDQVGVYYLVPGMVGPDGQPKILSALAILKRNLRVVNFGDITNQDPEIIAKLMISKADAEEPE